MSGYSDPVAEAASRGVGMLGAPATMLAQAELLANGADPALALSALLGMIEQHPTAERLQLLAVRLLERLRGRAEAIVAWRSFMRRFARNHDALLINLRWILRTEGGGPAASALASWFAELPDLPPDMLLLARGLEELGEHALADAAMDRLLRLNPTYEPGWLARIQMEERRGRPWQAQIVAQAGLIAAGLRPRLQVVAERLATDMAVLDPIVAPVIRAQGGDVGSLVLARLVEQAAARRVAPPPAGDVVGPVIMVGGSLGAGGAERQMVISAIGLQRAHLEQRRIGGRLLSGAHVMCRSIEGRPAAGFFAPDLEAEQVTLQCYSGFPATTVEGMDELLRFVSPRVAEATMRMTGPLRAMAPGIVHLWQDGTILACALACLLAGIPRIVLSVRTAPPQDRPERGSPEYEQVYPLLARMPGVVWTTNSHFAAARYAATVGMDPARMRVVPNGVAALPVSGSAATRAMMARFGARCGPGFTVGAVMRMDENKRPLEFVDCATRLVVARPDARFILVGDGPLRTEAEARMREAGLSDRFLFTGRSADVGYWLAQMDALLLLSRVEGLPNVLLEAQLAGVPVVATPAGGTAEAMRHGSTGYLLHDAATLRRDEVVARLLDIAAADGRQGPMGRAARRFVAGNFSVAQMLEGTVESYVQ